MWCFLPDDLVYTGWTDETNLRETGHDAVTRDEDTSYRDTTAAYSKLMDVALCTAVFHSGLGTNQAPCLQQGEL